jgi:hypothetical protein
MWELVICSLVREFLAVHVRDGAVASAVGPFFECEVGAPCGQADVENNVRLRGDGIGRWK